MQGKQKPPKIYADKGYSSQDNREFLSMNRMADGIMRNDYRNAKLTELEHERNKGISKIRSYVYSGQTNQTDQNNSIP